VSKPVDVISRCRTLLYMSPDLRALTVILCVMIEFIFASLKKICSNVINAGLYTFKNAALAYAKCQDI
jgi:hypothetical protein